MPPRKKPRVHPRSLDALFPRPKVRRCPAGHTQTPEWRMSWGCQTCRKNEEEFAARQAERTAERKGANRREREEWQALLGPPPAALEMRETSTGRLIRFTIPPHLRKQARRQRRRR